MDQFLCRAFKKALIFSLFLVFSLTGCSSSNAHKIASKKSVKKIRGRFPYDPLVLDPRKGADLISSTAHFLLYEGLTRMTPDSTRSLALAESVDISPDKTIYTFHLRNAFWSDGHPVIADDFVYSWASMLDPNFNCPNAHLLYPIKNAEEAKKGLVSLEAIGVKALDTKTLEVKLEKPTPYFLDLTSFCVLFPVPKHIVENNAKWANGANPDLVTNGPFTLKSWKIGNALSFVKNDRFWQAEAVHVNEIEYPIISQELTAINLFERGEIDFLGGISMTDWIPKLSKEGKLRSSAVGASTVFCFNLERFPFHNRHIRKAFTYAINRKAIVKNITQLNETPATSAIAPCLRNNRNREFFPDAAIEKAQKHLQKALKELGIEKKDLHGLCYHYYSDDSHRRIAQVVQSHIKEVLGIKLRLVESEFKVLLDKLNTRDYDLGQMYLIAQYNDRMNILDRFKLRSSLKNYPGWENQEYISLLDQSAFAETREEREALLEKAEGILLSDLPFSPIYHWNVIYLKQPYVEGFFYSPVGSLHMNQVNIIRDEIQN